jgi:hypothetical protein
MIRVETYYADLFPTKQFIGSTYSQIAFSLLSNVEGRKREQNREKGTSRNQVKSGWMES